MKIKDWTRIHSAEINFARNLKGYTKMDRVRYKDRSTELKFFSLNRRKKLKKPERNGNGISK
jgi:hypothetical protein